MNYRRDEVTEDGVYWVRVDNDAFLQLGELDNGRWRLIASNMRVDASRLRIYSKTFELAHA